MWSDCGDLGIVLRKRGIGDSTGQIGRDAHDVLCFLSPEL